MLQDRSMAKVTRRHQASTYGLVIQMLVLNSGKLKRYSQARLDSLMQCRDTDYLLLLCEEVVSLVRLANRPTLSQ
jgi:hypothetical protein